MPIRTKEKFFQPQHTYRHSKRLQLHISSDYLQHQPIEWQRIVQLKVVRMKMFLLFLRLLKKKKWVKNKNKIDIEILFKMR